MTRVSDTGDTTKLPAIRGVRARRGPGDARSGIGPGETPGQLELDLEGLEPVPELSPGRRLTQDDPEDMWGGF